MKSLFIILFGFYSSILISADYYWVGGSGDWSDISHWAAESGGSVTYPSIPTSEDNVIFDENSFTAPGQSVNIEGDIIFVNNVDWTGVGNMPRFTSSNKASIQVFGDFLLSSEMILDIEGKILFTGLAGEKRIDLKGHILRGAMTIDGESTWQVESELAIDSMLEIRRGSFSLNGHPLKCRFLHLNSDGNKVVDIRNSEILISGAYRDEYGYDALGSVSFYILNNNLELLSEASSIVLSAENATFYHLGGQNDIFLESVSFTAPQGQNYLTSEWYEEAVNIGVLSFNSNALIEGSINARTLNLTQGGRYRFGAEKQYLFNEINAAGDCVEGVIITSDNPGLATEFEVTSGSINMDYVSLRDIHVLSSSLLMPSNATDLGNNKGWDFSTSEAVDFYWIGGSGTWDDPTHWSFISGGSPSGCVPSGKDNAFFDLNSFTGPNQNVSLTKNATFIHDLLWLDVIGNPEFSGNPMQRIVITGSLELAAKMEHEIEGFYDFESNENSNTITVNGNLFKESISFSGINGGWTFLDDVEVHRTTYLKSGRLDLNGFQLSTTRFNSSSVLPRSLNLENSTLLLRESLALGPEWIVDLANYQVNAINSTIRMTSNGNFDHNGSSNGVIPHYNLLVFDNLNSGVRSVDQSSDESVPAIYVEELIFTARGRLAGSNHIGKLQLADGFSYFFDASNNRRQVIDEMFLQGSCANGLTHISSSEPGNQANLALSESQELERVQFQDINVISGSLINNNSIDGGNNENMTFNELQARNLYWVGNSGQWQDPAHWSLMSGGSGGECIPTSIDNVVFDENSFRDNDQKVWSIPSTDVPCHNLSIRNLFGRPTLDLDLLSVAASLVYDMSFTNNVDQLTFVGNEEGQVATGGQEMRDVRFRKDGSITFLDDFSFSRWTHESGTVFFGSYQIEGRSMYFYGGGRKELDLGSSQIFLTEEGDAFNDRGSNLSTNPGTSQLVLSGESAGVFSREGLSFNKVHFTNSRGQAYLASRFNWDNSDNSGFMNVNTLVFNGGGRTYGHVNTDSLMGVPGKVYILDSDRRFTASTFFRLRGNNCTPIELRSSVNVIKAELLMPSNSTVDVDFVQMRDISASGGAVFNAGSRSVDVGNSNKGWIFEDAPDFEETGFLGLDRAICGDEAIVLEAYNYSVNESYLWSDGSRASSIHVDEAGTYFVEVQFESNCVLRDTVNIFAMESFQSNLQEEEFICAEGSIELDARIQLDGAKYSWNTGANSALIEIDEEGWYFIEVEALGCSQSDSVFVQIIPDPGSFLPADSSLCESTIVYLTPTLEASEYTWSDGSKGEVFQGEVVENIWLDVLIGTCTFRDTVYFEISPLPDIDLPLDTSFCDNEFLRISMPDIYTYLWSDGSTSNEIEITEAGEYTVRTQNQGCERLDTFIVTKRPAPVFSLGQDLEVCESERLELRAPLNIDLFEWNDGSMDSTLSVSASGVYWIQAENKGCRSRDSIEVTFLPLPLINLGSDTTVCDDQVYRLSPIEVSIGDLTWHDGTSDLEFEVGSPGLIRASIFDGFCENTDSVLVSFKDCVYFDIFVPNAFSPNADGFNDKFEVFFPDGLIVNAYSIEIYNRWGNLVFKEDDLHPAWDGTLNNVGLSDGIYIYHIKLAYEDENGPDEFQITGDVAIIR